MCFVGTPPPLSGGFLHANFHAFRVRAVSTSYLGFYYRLLVSCVEEYKALLQIELKNKSVFNHRNNNEKQQNNTHQIETPIILKPLPVVRYLIQSVCHFIALVDANQRYSLSLKSEEINY